MMIFSSAFLILTTTCLRVLPLSSFLRNRSAPPGRGTESRMLPHSNEASVPFRWWMRSAATSPYERQRGRFARSFEGRFEAERKSEKHVPGRMKFRPSRRAVWGGLARSFALQFSNINSCSFHHHLINIFADFIEIVLNPVIINAKDGITPIH